MNKAVCIFGKDTWTKGVDANGKCRFAEEADKRKVMCGRNIVENKDIKTKT